MGGWEGGGGEIERFDCKRELSSIFFSFIFNYYKHKFNVLLKLLKLFLTWLFLIFAQKNKKTCGQK